MSGLRSRGFTLVEMLVVVAIIGILIGMLLPAVQAARESGRRLHCINNLKQISLAMLNHENAIKRFPTGGWGRMWVGDPDMGNNENQPGGWIYNTLPFLEQGILHNIGLGMTGNDKLDAAAKMIAVPLPEFICPTRRAAELFPYHPDPSLNPKTYNAAWVSTAGRTDYAVSRGVFSADVDAGDGPKYYDDPNYKWPDPMQILGVCFVRSMIRAIDISDGLSNTYLLGEKYVNSLEYTSGNDPGDNASLCQGDCFDIARNVAVIEYKDGKPQPPMYIPPIRDMRTYYDQLTFGSAHPTTWQASFCDGSVHVISYDIDQELHYRLGVRNDGLIVDKSKLAE